MKITKRQLRRIIRESMHSGMTPSYRGGHDTDGTGGKVGPAGARGGGEDDPQIARIRSGLFAYAEKEQMAPIERKGLLSAFHYLEMGKKFKDDASAVARAIEDAGLTVDLMDLLYALYDADGDTGEYTNFARDVYGHTTP